MTVTDKEVEYVPYEAPNKLVDRLTKLIAEYEAGHKGHGNEILAITSSLRSTGYIE